MNSTRVFLFPPFRLDVQNEQLWRENQLVALRPKTLAVLHYLVAHAGRLITKKELLTAVWGTTHVSESLPKDYVQELRKALDDNPKSPRFIETVHGRGYRFVAPITITPPVDSPQFSVVSSDTAIIKPRQLATGNWQLATPLVGREAELAQLQKWLDKALRGQRQVVFVTGEPGIGKTTLVETFLQQAVTLGEVSVARGQCLEHYGAGEAYMPVLAALGALSREQEDGFGLPALLARYAPTWLLEMPSLVASQDVEALRRRVQGATRERMLREMSETLEAFTRDHPLIFVLEDLHWSDYSTLDLISVLAQRRSEAKLFVIATYRPAETRQRNHPLHAVHQELRMHRQCEELALQFLPETAVAAYLAARFPDSHFPVAFSHTIHKRTEGNPLFMVNMVDYLVSQGLLSKQRGAWEIQVSLQEIERGAPENIRRMIEQQFDQLDPRDHQLLEVASVAGGEFSAAAVAGSLQETEESVDERYAALARKGLFLRSLGHQEWPDGSIAGRYGFIHTLYQEVMYRRLTPSRRLRLHRNIGEREEAGYGDHCTDIANELALHFERCRHDQRAVRYLRMAGENALRRCAYQEAIDHGAKALALLHHAANLPERNQQEVAIQLMLGTSLLATRGYASPEVEQAYARARDLCRQLGETSQLFPTLWGLWVMYFVRGDLDAAQPLAEQLHRLARDTGDASLLLEACVAMGLTEVLLGRFGSALEHLEQGIGLYDLEQHHSHAFVYGQDPGVVCLSWAAWALWFLGYPDRAQQRSREAIALARRLTSPFSLVYALGCAAVLHQFCQDAAETETCARENIDLSATQGFTFWLAAGHILLGWALTEKRRFDDGLAELYTGLTSWQATGAGFLQSYGFALLPEAYQKTGQIEEGLVALSNAFVIVDKNRERVWEAELYRLYGELSLRDGETATGRKEAKKNRTAPPLPRFPVSSPEEAFFKALAISREQQAKSLELRAGISLARLWRQQGKRLKARELLSPIYNWFTEGFNTVDLQTAKQLLNE